MPKLHLILGGGIDDAKKKAAYIGIAKERQDTYKTSALSVSEGYKVFNGVPFFNPNMEVTNDETTINNIEAGEKNASKILITIADTKSVSAPGTKEPIAKFGITVQQSGVGSYTEEKSAPLEQSKEQTIEVKLPNNMKFSDFSINIKKNAPSYNVSFKVKGIKVIYKD